MLKFFGKPGWLAGCPIFYAWSLLLHPPSGAPSIETRNAHVSWAAHVAHDSYYPCIGAKFRTIGWIDLGRHVYVDNAISIYLSVCLSVYLIYSYLFLSILIYSILMLSYTCIM